MSDELNERGWYIHGGEGKDPTITVTITDTIAQMLESTSGRACFGYTVWEAYRAYKREAEKRKGL